jgi:hypothetical protein
MFHQWLLAGQEENVFTEDGKSVLRYNRRARIFFTAVALVAVCIAAIPMIFAPTWQAKVLLSVMVGWMAVFGIVCMLEATVTSIRFDDYQLCVRSPWRGYREVPWGDVVDISYSSMLSRMKIETKNYGIISVSDYLSGSAVLAREARQRLMTRRLQENDSVGGPSRSFSGA